MKNKNIIFILIFLIFLTSCTKYNTIYIDNGAEEIKIKAEVADTQEKRERGLQFRKHLDENSGMFFVFGADADYSFWMKNTLIPLDIIWIDEDKVIHIEHALPCSIEPCTIYSSTTPVKYVLEASPEFVTDNNLVVGTEIRIDISS